MLHENNKRESKQNEESHNERFIRECETFNIHPDNAVKAFKSQANTIDDFVNKFANDIREKIADKITTVTMELDLSELASYTTSLTEHEAKILLNYYLKSKITSKVMKFANSIEGVIAIPGNNK